MTSGSRTRLRAGAGLVAAASLLLAGCSGGAGAQAEPGWEPSLTPSAAPDWPPVSVLEVPEPSPPVPEGPPSEAHATAYVDYLLDEVDYALRTTYVDKVLRIGECSLCDYVVDLAERAGEKRWLHEHEDWDARVVRAKRIPPNAQDPATYWRLRVLVLEPEVRTVNEAGEVVNTVPASQRMTTLVVGQLHRSWRMLGWQLVDDGSLYGDA